MKVKILGLAAGAAMLGLTATTVSARTDVYVGIELGIPAPIVVERRTVHHSYDYGYQPAPVYHYESREYPRRYVRRPGYQARYYERHDRGHHRGHHKHKHCH